MTSHANGCPRLIEVALPIRELSAEGVRDKSLRHGHFSTLHLWWARRPLPVARAITFATLVPDPDHPHCPPEFRAAVERLLKTDLPSALKFYHRGRKALRDPDPYRPYDGLPDTPRNRLLAFIAKWSPEMRNFEAGKGALPKPEYLLDDRSLAKWETSDPTNPQGQAVLAIARALIRIANGGAPPTVLDPFAGGGAIPLEAGRLGCQPIANDYNPVAYLVLRAGCEFPQRFGAARPLAEDVARWAGRALECARQRLGALYPPGADGAPVVGYLWARTIPCANPSCQAEIPLLRSLLVCDKSNKRVAVTMTPDPATKTIQFGIAKGKAIQADAGPKRQRGVAICPFCAQPTTEAQIRQLAQAGQMRERMIAVITEGNNGKDYRPVEPSDLEAFERAVRLPSAPLNEPILPEITADDAEDGVSNSTGIRVHLYGMRTWGSLFNPRQRVAMHTFVECVREVLAELRDAVPDPDYRQALGAYLGIWISRVVQRMSGVSVWDTKLEAVIHPFGRQAIPMVWDYPEVNPLSESTGGAEGGIDWIVRVIGRESQGTPARVLLGDAARLPLAAGSVDAVVTDPPYFDAIAYADLSDYFYVWLKRTVGDLFPEAFATPLTPKADEATALRHRHNGDRARADAHFRAKLTQALVEARRIAGEGPIVVMFAHQSTEAWSALIDAVFAAKLTLTATWAISTELTSALKSGKSVLESSITVVCRPRVAGRAATYPQVRREVEAAVREAVQRFWDYGLRGADLIVACYGPAVGAFGRYERVEKADGSPVSVEELLTLARRTARDAIAGPFRADSLSTLYYVWANLYGASEQAWDDARLFLQVGGDSERTLADARARGLFVVEGARCRLALLNDRDRQRDLGQEDDPPRIDALHRAMILWRAERRTDLVRYLTQRNLLDDDAFWRLAQALFEVLPREVEDWKLISTLLSEREALRAESRRSDSAQQMSLL